MYRLIPVVISFFLLAAHSMRIGGMDGIFFMWASTPLLLLFKRKWVANVLAILLIFGAVIWILVTLKIWNIRSSYGAPKIRMALILGGVALFTASSALVFFSEKVKNRYFSGTYSAIPGTAAFVIITILLSTVQIRLKNPPGLLLERFIRNSAWLENFWIAACYAFTADFIQGMMKSHKKRALYITLVSTAVFVLIVYLRMKN